jgi:hypothetical protein
MTKWILACAMALLATAASAQYAPSYGTGANPNSHTNSGYTTSTGTYVSLISRLIPTVLRVTITVLAGT